MKISIVTPTYNSASFLENCLQSVAAQEDADFEHLIIDGLSSDGTVSLVKSYQTRYPHLRLLSEKDRGIYDAMNKGLRLFEGDYVMFLGSDDRLHSSSVLRDVFTRASKPYSKVIYGNIATIGTGLKGLPDGAIYDGPFDFDKIICQNICHQAIFYSREMVRQVGEYNADYKYFADWDYNLRCFGLTKFDYVDLVVSDYNTAGLSGGGGDHTFYLAFFDDLKRYFGLSIFDSRLEKLADWLLYIGKVKLRQKRDPRGLYYLTAAIFHSPRLLLDLLGHHSAKN